MGEPRYAAPAALGYNSLESPSLTGPLFAVGYELLLVSGVGYPLWADMRRSG